METFSQVVQAAEQGYVPLSRPAARAVFHAADVPEEVIAADDAVAAMVPGGVMGNRLDPDYMAAQAARIDVPVFLAFGDIDSTADGRGEPRYYTGARDITLLLLAGSAHCHNFATTRTMLWDRLARWVAALAPESER